MTYDKKLGYGPSDYGSHPFNFDQEPPAPVGNVTWDDIYAGHRRGAGMRRGAQQATRAKLNELNQDELSRVIQMSGRPVSRGALAAARGAVTGGMHPAVASAAAKGLDLSHSARMGRARDLGFTLPARHGTYRHDADWQQLAGDLISKHYFGTNEDWDPAYYHSSGERDFQRIAGNPNARKTSTALGPHFAPDASSIPGQFAYYSRNSDIPGRIFPVLLRGGVKSVTQPHHVWSNDPAAPPMTDDNAVHADVMMRYFESHPLEAARMIARNFSGHGEDPAELAHNVMKTGMLGAKQGGPEPLWFRLYQGRLDYPGSQSKDAIQYYRKHLQHEGTPILEYHNTGEHNRNYPHDQRSWIQTEPAGIRSVHAVFDPDLADEAGLNYAEGGGVLGKAHMATGGTTPALVFSGYGAPTFTGLPDNIFNYGQGPEQMFFNYPAVNTDQNVVVNPGVSPPGTSNGPAVTNPVDGQGGALQQAGGGNPEQGVLDVVSRDFSGSGGGNERGGNPNAGQIGSAADPGSLGSRIGGMAVGRLGSLLGVGTPAAIAGIIGTLAQEGVLGPNLAGFQNRNIDINPAAYMDFANESPGWLGDLASQSAASRAQHSIDEANAAAGVGSGQSSGGWGSIETTGDPGARDFAADPNRDSSPSDAGGGEGIGGGGTSEGCFDGRTPILMANGLSKSIGQIGVGDMVAAFKGAAPWVARRVTALVTVGTVKPTICIDGVYVTRNHRFLRPDETWTRAEDLKPGDEIVRADGTLLVVSGMWEGGNRPVYNFTVDELHTYIAGGMRVHNMKDAKGGRVRISRRPRNPHLALRLAA